MTRMPLPWVHLCGGGLWFHVAGSALRLPQRAQNSCGLSSGGGLFFFGHAAPWNAMAGKGIDRCASRHILPPRAAAGPTRLGAIIVGLRGEVADTKGQVRCAPTQAEAAQSRRGAHAPANGGLLSYCRLRQGWIGRDTSFLPKARADAR